MKYSDVTKDWDTDREVDKLLWADVIIYIMPIMWFNMPAPMVKWLDDVLKNHCGEIWMMCSSENLRHYRRLW